MEKFINYFIGLSIAFFCTLSMAMGVEWIKGDTEMVFKAFGGFIFAFCLGLLTYNFIKSLGIK